MNIISQFEFTYNLMSHTNEMPSYFYELLTYPVRNANLLDQKWLFYLSKVNWILKRNQVSLVDINDWNLLNEQIFR